MHGALSEAALHGLAHRLLILQSVAQHLSISHLLCFAENRQNGLTRVGRSRET